MNNRKLAEFSKVSFEEYYKTFNKIYKKSFDEDFIRAIYNNITIPTRATFGAAAYDFKLPFGIALNKKHSIMIPTGIRVTMPEDNGMFILPKSGTGSNYRLSLVNTEALIDGDYAYSDNEGHILLKIVYDAVDAMITPKSFVKDGNKISIDEFYVDTNTTPDILTMEQGDGFAQATIYEYKTSKTDDTNKMKRRNGGFGSTGN